ELHRKRRRCPHRGSDPTDKQSAPPSVRSIRRRARARGAVPRPPPPPPLAVGRFPAPAKSAPVTGSVLSLPRWRRSMLLRILPSGRALIVGIATVSIVAGLYGIARETGMFAIERIEIRGTTPAIVAQAQAVLRSFEGTNLLSLNGAAVVQRLESLPT